MCGVIWNRTRKFIILSFFDAIIIGECRSTGGVPKSHRESQLMRGLNGPLINERGVCHS